MARWLGKSLKELTHFFLEKIRLTYKRYTWLPEALVQKAISQKWERSLAIFIILRKTYKNPIFYNFTYRKLSNKTSISVSTLQRHINKLIELELVSIHNGNLCLIGSDKLRKSLPSPLIAVQADTNKNKQILNIQFTRLLKNLRQQRYIAKLKAETIKLQEGNHFISTKDAKNIIKKRNTYLSQNEKLEDNYCISNKGLATIVNRRSTTTGNNLQKKLNEFKMVKSEKNIELMPFQKLNKRAFYELCFPGNYFLGKDGLVRKRKPNKITICK